MQPHKVTLWQLAAAVDDAHWGGDIDDVPEVVIELAPIDERVYDRVIQILNTFRDAGTVDLDEPEGGSVLDWDTTQAIAEAIAVDQQLRDLIRSAA